jgi:hypothetical protein
MKLLASTVVLCFLILVIGSSLACSCMGLKEGFATAASWKLSGEAPWDGPYSVPNSPSPPDGMFIFANNKSSPDCCKAATYSSSDGCVCTTPSQVKFLNERGGNRTIEDGF